MPSHVLSRKAAGETVLLNLDSEEYYGLDAVGDRLWGLLEGGTTFGQVIAALLDDYEVRARRAGGRRVGTPCRPR